MARIRTIKPEFWQNETLAELDAMTRLLAIGLLNHADDEGYFRASPALVRAAVFPFDDSVNALGLLLELSRAGYLSLADGSDGRKYGMIAKFQKHQRVDKPKPSEIKGICTFQESSKNHPRIIQDESLQERKGKEQGKEGKGVGGSDDPQPSQTDSKPKTKTLVTLTEYTEIKKASGEKIIPENHSVHDYAKDIKLPPEFLALAWHEFKSRYLNENKKYKDWPGVFLKAVKGNWFKVWYHDGTNYGLTTVGIQAQMAMKSRKAA